MDLLLAYTSVRGVIVRKFAAGLTRSAVEFRCTEEMQPESSSKKKLMQR